MSYVFLLNMTYDVPVKLLSFVLVLLSLFLLAPDFRRLLNFFLLNRTAEPSRRPLLFRTLRANHIALAVQAVFAVWLIAANIWGAHIGWKQYGPGAPKPALYGIWEVDEFSTDGQLRPPLLTDNARWHRILFDYETMELEHMDSTTAFFSAAIDTKKNTLALNQYRAGNAKLSLTFSRPAPDQLILDGPIDGHKTHIQLRLRDRNKFLLVNRGFHWIQEYPYNR
jgi:hypothetical protein